MKMLVLQCVMVMFMVTFVKMVEVIQKYGMLLKNLVNKSAYKG